MLPITDAAWLMNESRETPQHVGGLMTFQLPDDAPESWLRDLWQRWRSSTEFVHPFSSRLDRPYGIAKGIFNWTPDANIDLDYHLRFSALPRPGRVRELLVLASRLHSTLLDRHRPLWEVHLIEGLEGDRFAIYAKFHHSMFDGVGAMRVLKRMLTADPTTTDMPAPWEVSSAKPPAAVEATDADLVPKGTDMAGALASVGPVARALGHQISGLRAKDPGVVMPFSAPRSLLNGRITGARRFAADGFSFDRIQGVAKALGVSLNDVVLAMSSQALRTYLTEHGGVPAKPLTAIIPVSVRSEGDDAAGNALSFLVADLATDLADPERRLERITASMTKGKALLSGLSRTEQVGYAIAITSPYVLGPLLGFAGRGRPVASTVISNVPGPRTPQYYDGARMLGMYPASLLQQGQALNITLLSYHDELQFGLTAARQTLPSMQRMLDHLEDGLSTLEKMAAA